MFSITTKVRFMSVTTIFVMLFSLMSISPAVAAGAPGSLDTTFGTDGKAIVDFGGNEDAPALAVDSSGRILLAGWDGDYPDLNFGVARLNPDGTPDTTFGTDGFTIVDFGANDLVYAIAIDEVGHILVSGYTSGWLNMQPSPWLPPRYEYTQKFAVARLNTDGTLDSSFGEGGKALLFFDTPERKVSYAFDMKIDKTGRILLSGSSSVVISSNADYMVINSDITIARLNPNGSLDEGFGEYGFALIDFGNNEVAMDMELDEAGRIIVAAGSDTWANNEWISSRFLLTRLNSNGSLDTSFGQNGQTTYDFGGYNYPTALSLDDMGRIVVTGMTLNYDDPSASPAVVARFNSDGTFDESFGTGGYRTLDFGGAFLALDKAGHIIITGGTPDDNSDFGVLQLNEDGTPDSNFDGDGFATIDFGGYDYSSAIVLDGADHILLAGGTDANGTLDFAVARLNASPTAIPMSIKGFYSPVDMNGVWNTVKGGSTVPLQFEVFDGEDEITDVSVIDQPLQATQALCDGGPSDTVEVVSTGGTSLRYDETLGQFVYNWKTPKKPGYCYVVTVTLEDGASLSANFKLK